MEHLIAGVRDAIRKECWYPALAQALAIPDACGAIDDPGRGRSYRRYRAWFDKYVAQDFTSPAPHSQPFFTAHDLYQARCAYLHQADLEFHEPDMPKFSGGVVGELALFVVDDGDLVPSLNGSGDLTYSVGVKDLCESICCGAENWLVEARKDPQKAAALASLKRITRITKDGRWVPV